jgi:hypothetical protein
MAVLTPEQIARILEIIRDGSTAIAIATTGYKFPKDELERLVREGYVKADELEDFVKDSFAFGQLMQQQPAAKTMSYADFQKHIERNPIVMSKPEQQAYNVASNRAGMYCVGLGSRYGEVAGQAIIEHDDKLAARLRGGIKREVSEAVARRETVGQLKTRLGQMAGDWERDWGRVAATESQMAHQEGFLGAVAERYGDDELLAKVPEPDACEHCLKHYLENGKPKVRPASWWYEQGTSNAGRKSADWKPVLGAMHPWCRCQLVRVPAGWEFDDAWSLVPADDTEKSLAKARKLQGRMKWNGFDISIENRAGSVRRWYDPGTGTEGQTKMRIPYGYIRMTEGVDGDHVDVFVGPHENAPKVYVVHQMKAPSFKVFDEDKCMLGFKSAKAAKRAYLQHFDQPGFFGSMTAMTIDAFRAKVFERKGEMIKGQLQLDYAQQMAKHEAAIATQEGLEPHGIDAVDLWKKAVESVGIRPEDFGLVVKHARQGHPQARKALDAVYAELGKGFPIEHASTRPETVGSMGNHSQPARTAGENVRSHRNAPPQDYPMGRKEQKRKGRRQKDPDKPRAADKLDVAGHTQGKGGWGHGYDAEAVMDRAHDGAEPQDRAAAREGLEVQQRSRAALRQGSKMSDMEIHR